MTKQEVLQQVEVIFRQVLKRDDVTLTGTTTAAQVEGWDSLTNMTLISEVEKHFGCKFSFREIVKFKDVDALCDAVVSKKA